MLSCPWNFPGKNTGMGCHLLLRVIFLNQGSNLHLLHLLNWQADFYHCATWEAQKGTDCMHNWGKFWATRYKKAKKTNCLFWRAGSITKLLGAKAKYCTSTLHQIPPKWWANHLSHPSGPKSGPTLTLTPYKELAHPILEERALESVTYFHSPTAATESQLSLAWTSYLTCYQFLFTKDSQEPWSVTLPWFNFVQWLKFMNCLLQKRKLRFGDIKLFADGQIVDKGGNCP